METKQEWMKEIETLVASQSEYRTSIPGLNLPVTLALDVADFAATFDLISFGVGSAAGAIGVVKVVVDNFIALTNALQMSEHYYEKIGAADAAAAWAFADPIKPKLSPAIKRNMSQMYLPERLEKEWGELTTAYDQAVTTTYQKMDMMATQWILKRWPQATSQTGGGGGFGAHMRAGRRPLLAAPLPRAQPRRQPPPNPKAVFKLMLVMEVKNDRRGFHERLLRAAAKGMNQQSRHEFGTLTGLTLT